MFMHKLLLKASSLQYLWYHSFLTLQLLPCAPLLYSRAPNSFRILESAGLPESASGLLSRNYRNLKSEVEV